MPPLLQKLRRLQRRLLVFQFVERAARSLLVASVAACLWLVITRLFPQLGDALIVSCALAGGGVLGALVWTLRKPPRLSDAALAADARLGLKERFTSSLALHEAGGSLLGGSEAMASALHADAAHCLAQLDNGRDFPFTPSKTMRWAAVPLVAFGLAYVLFPEIDLLGYEAREAQARVEQAERKQAAEMLENAARVLPREPDKADAELEAISMNLEEVAAAMQEGRITEKQALARIANLADQLRQQRDALQKKAGAPSPQLLPQGMGMAREAAEALKRGRPSDAAKALRALQEKLSKDGMSEAEKKQLAQDLQKLAESMGNSDAAQQLMQALQHAGEGSISASDLEMALDAMNLSLSDMASVLEQMAKLDAALQQMTEWERQQCGLKSLAGKKCKSCGGPLKIGQCQGNVCNACNGLKPGTGVGPLTGGELPEDPDVNHSPGVLPGSMQQGKMLADILQRAAPDAEGQEATVAASGPALIRVQQDAEQALTKEEVPPGAREFVRQYFGTIDTEQ